MTPRSRITLLLGVLALVAGCRATAEDEGVLPMDMRVVFEGAVAMDDEDLRTLVARELARLEVTEPTKASIDDAAFALELFYRSRGFPDVLVDYEFTPGDGGPPIAEFRVSEGPLVRVRTLALEGVEGLTEEEVRAQLPRAAPGTPFDQDALRADAAALRRVYLQRGYQDVEIRPFRIEFDENRTAADLELRIAEGPIFVVKDVSFSGGVEELRAIEESLSAAVVGELFSLPVLPGIENAVLEEYRREGYPDAEVDARTNVDQRDGSVRLFLVIQPGPKVTITDFRITGNERTRDSAILAAIDIEKGDVYDADRFREAFRDLYSMGLFESVQVRLEGDGAERILAIDVVEARSVLLRLEPGWGSYEGPRFLLGIEENNFLGRGQRLALEGTISAKAVGSRITWIDRNFMGTEFTSETSFFIEEREEPSFVFKRRGFGFFLRRDWTDDWSSNVGYEYRPTNVTDDPSFALSPDVESDTNVAAFSAALSYDNRDNLLLPTRGTLARARVEWADDAFASDTEFLRGQLELSHLLGIGETVVATSARTGVIAPFGITQEIPLPERFFNGGESTVRSFGEDELLPPGRDGEPLGGEAATTLNLELRRMLSGNLAGAAFVDFGNVTEDYRDYFDFEGFRTGVGLGIRYMLPVGPVRLDVALNPSPESDEDEVVWHFSVGFPF